MERSLPPGLKRYVERELKLVRERKGMQVGMPKVCLLADHVEYLMKYVENLENELNLR
jgi:hypothetical protein